MADNEELVDYDEEEVRIHFDDKAVLNNRPVVVMATSTALLLPFSVPYNDTR